MIAHFRANLWLLGLTLLICAGLYPAALWGVGQAAFRERAAGSLVYDGAQPIASRLIAHEVKGDAYFQPRPSATGGSAYNASASGPSNLAANNYLLRDRVARALGPVVRYRSSDPKKAGAEVAPDVVRWFREERPDLAAEWAKAHPGLAQAWVKAEDVAKAYVTQWFAEHSAELVDWEKAHPNSPAEQPEGLAVPFFVSFAGAHPATWLAIDSGSAKPAVKTIALVTKDSTDAGDIAAVFFDLWRDAHPDVRLADVPADLVMASASGLDPHITLANARFQLPRVATKWAELTKQDAVRVQREVEDLLRQHAAAPLFGLAGVAMVNVVELNVALHQRYAGQVRP